MVVKMLVIFPSFYDFVVYEGEFKVKPMGIASINLNPSWLINVLIVAVNQGCLFPEFFFSIHVHFRNTVCI